MGHLSQLARIVPHFTSPKTESGVVLAHCGPGCLFSSHFRGMCEALASLVFPAPCRICARSLDTGSRIPFCHACMEALMQPLPEPLCTQCCRTIVSAAVAEGNSLPLCHLCRSGIYAFDFARSFGA